MEAVPKLPMLSFNLKQTLQKTSFSKLKQYIAECYNEDPDTYSKEIYDLEVLRAAAFNPSNDVMGCNIIKRYYCQLHSLQNRFPIAQDRTLVSFNWRGIYMNTSTQSSDIQHDMAVALYNYAALHTQLGAAVNRSDEDEMKVACTHFQCAAWAFETVREKYQSSATGDLLPEMLIFMQQVSFAQAQECILEKSLIDNRKPLIVAKVTAQIIEYYNAGLAALLSGGEDGIICEVIGNKTFKEWKQYIQFKVQYLTAILLLYQGQHSEEQQKMGERVVLFQTAFERLEEARKESKGLNNIQQINEALIFVTDVIEAKRKAAKNENEFIYHEEVPDLSSIATIPGANLVKGTSFSLTDPAVTSEDIFHRLVPLKTHESSSLYSEEKANLLRKISHKIEARDNELNKFMESLNSDSFNYDASNVKLPQALIDRCAELNSKPNSIPELIEKMSLLAEICVDVENTLHNIQDLLKKEEYDEKNFEQTVGLRPSSHFTELNREFMKYQEAHNKASDSNDTLRRAMELHVNNLKILAKPLTEVQAAIPVCTADINPEVLAECRNLFNKVNEMRVQRAMLFQTLSENIQKDDITAQLIAWGEKNVETLFQTELAKHEKLISIIEQNMVAQGNILKVFTEAYAKCAHYIKSVADTKHKREIFFGSLIASYDVYDDLLGKSLKGLEFYKKLQSSIHKLHARVRSARDVHEEERQQHLDTLNKKMANMAVHEPLPTMPTTYNDQDYSNAGRKTTTYDTSRSSLIRPTPIGQENTGMPSNCINSVGYSNRQLDSGHGVLKNDLTTNQYIPTDADTLPSVPNSYAISNPQTFYASRVTSTVSTAMTNAAQPAYSSQGQSFSYNNPSHSSNNSTGYVNPIYGNIPTSYPSPAPSPSQIYYNDQSTRSNTSYVINPQYPADLNAYAGPSGQPSVHPKQPNIKHSNLEPSQNVSYSSQNIQFNTNNNSYIASKGMQQPQQNYTQYQKPQFQPEILANTQTSSTFYTPQQNIMPNQQYLDSAYSKNDSTYLDPANSYRQTVTVNQYTSMDYAGQQTAYPQPTMQSNYQPQEMGGLNQPNNTSMCNSIQYSQSHSHIDVQQQQHQQQQQQQQQQLPAYNYSQTTSVGLNPNTLNSYTQSIPTVNYSNPTVPTDTYYNAEYRKDDPNVQQYYVDPSMSQYPTANQANYTDTNAVTYLNTYSPNPVTTIGYTTDLNSGQTYNNYYNTTQYSGSTVDQNVSYIPQTTTNITNPNPNPNNSSEQTSVAPVPPKPVQPQKTEAVKPKTKIDLLSELDNLEIPAPTLQPIKSTEISSKTIEPTIVEKDTIVPTKPVIDTEKLAEPISSINLNESLDDVLNSTQPVDTLSKNISDVMSKSTESVASDALSTTSTTSATAGATPAGSINIEAFFKEVQRYEKMVNNLPTKTLNGTTPLEIKWKELQDILDKEAGKRSISVSKLFPDKNRNMLSVPYDHSRVLLPKQADNYINAAHVINLGPQHNHFILADAPASNTINDFWCMIWSEKSKFIVCLYTTDEIQNLLFPKQLNVEQMFSEYSVKVLKEQRLSHTIQRQIQITLMDANLSREISIIQIKSWSSKGSTGNIIGISQNIVEATKITDGPIGPILLNCATNCERSSLIALTITCILALNVETPVIINVNDVWHRICSQRHCVLNDISVLQFSMQIILNCCREFIKKRTLTAPTSNTQSKYYFIGDEEAPVKDPFKDLDPLWKLK